MRTQQAVKTIVSGILLAFSVNLSAGQVVVSGPDITYTYDDSTLFGTGTLIGNNLFFSPENFLAESDDGSGPTLVTDTLNITVSVNQGSNVVIDAIGLFETGDYILSGDSATVSASARTEVTSLTWTNGLFAPTNVQLVQTGTLTSPNDGSTTNWSLSNINDFVWGGETSVIYQIQNNLIASTTDGSDLAFIQKKSGQIGVVVNPVPIPAAAWLFGSALALFGVFSRRSRRP